MSSIGYIQAFAYTSRARIPLKNVAVTITDEEGSAIAMGLTDSSGKLKPVAVTVPNKSATLEPNPGLVPYARINLYARLPNYEQIEAEQVQVFADTVTTQNLEMIPLSELPNQWNKIEYFTTPGQNL